MEKLENEEYDAAIDMIEKLRDQKLEEAKKRSGELAENLVEVELTADNFNDYFEYIAVPVYNAFGEEMKGNYRIGLISRKYDEGLILYDMGKINVECLIKDIEHESASVTSLKNSLEFGTGISLLPLM